MPSRAFFAPTLQISALIHVALLSPAVLAQTPPDAGALQREAERAFPRVTPAPTLPAPSAPMKEMDKGATVTVRSFSIEGVTLVPVSELTSLLNDKIGQSLTLAELERVTRRITAYYRAKGWFARAYLPQQEVIDGVVRIVVVEGRFSGVLPDPGRPERADIDFATRIATQGLEIGSPLPAATLERNLLLANEQPGIRATGILEPGESVGDTRIRLKVEDAPLLTGDATLSNQGTRTTGVGQVAASLSLSPGDGSQGRLNTLLTSHLASIRAQYSLPLGSNGWRASVHASALRYTLGGDFASLDASGKAQTGGATVSYPFMRSGTTNLNTSALLEARRYADDSLDIATKRKRTNVLVLSANGDHSDSLFGGGINHGSFAVSVGRLDLSGLASDLNTDSTTARSQGAYSKLAGQFFRLQRLPGNFSLSASLAAQWAGKNLDSSEKFSLGGPYGVRAYPVNEASGDEGWLLNLELRNEIGHGWRAFGFYDSGRVQQHRTTWLGWQGGSNTPNQYGLSGAGIGLAWSKPRDLNLQLTLATPVGDHLGKTATGKNQDGSNRETRAWLLISKIF